MPGRDRIAATARQAEAVRLRANGQTFDEIGQALGITKQAAFKLVTRALEATLREPASQVRVIDLERLDQLQVEALAVLRRTHYVVQGGKIVRGDDGEPLVDDAPTLQAIATIVRLMERRARLLGLDAAQKHEVLTLDTIDAEIRRLEDQVAKTTPPPEANEPPPPEAAPPPAGDFYDHLGGAVEAALDALQLPEDQREVAAQAVEDHLRRHGAPSEEMRP
jgi:hypothetical protein